MEESMSLLLGIRDVFGCKNVDIRTYSPLTLAFVGDCIYDLVIRTVVVERGNTAPNTLHQKKSAVKNVDIRTYSPLTLAFVGDCIYDLVIRTVVVERGNTAPNTLHQKKSAVVKAQAQAAQAEAVFGELTEEEQAVYKRGRNAHSHSSAKNASIGDYRKQAQAAQAEAVFGELTEEEQAVYKRGRNAHSHSSAKNASIGDYRKATGLEALYGFLYLTDRTERLLYLVKKSLELTGTEL